MKTIAAISTPAGVGGIAIVRMSGESALDIALRLIKIEKIKSSSKIEPRKFYYSIYDDGVIKDEIMFVYFKAPKSYTGEDLVEIQCHGSSFIANRILKAFIENGAEAAESGEFTKRAFLNKRIDLTAAESVIDLINSENVSQVNSAFNAIQGGIYKKIESLQKEIITLTAKAEVAVDYPEEGIEEETKESILVNLSGIIEKLKNLINSFDDGIKIKEGIRIVIAGQTNVGKSSLMNALLEQERAIVTDIEGTTRDTLEESFSYKGLKFIITDTAGFRKTEDKVEKLGIERSVNAVETCDIVLLLSENGNEKVFIEGDAEELEKRFNNKKIIYVVNKIDKLGNEEKEKLKSSYNKVYISAKNKQNIDILKEAVFNTVNGSSLTGGGGALNNIRHYNAAVKALTALENAEANINAVTLDCIISDLNEGYRALGLITGVISSDEIIGEIFSRFCVGK